MLEGMPIEFVRCRLGLELLGHGWLPRFLGTTLRGCFGYAFKRVACASPPGPCRPCARPAVCPYSYVFETPILDSIPHLRADFAPHPFVLAPDDGEAPWADGQDGARRVHPGDPVDVELTLFGKAVRYLPSFVATFEEMARAGLGPQRIRFRLTGMHALDLDGRAVPIFEAARARLVGAPPIVTSVDVAARLPARLSGPASLEFQSPVKLRVDGRDVDRPDAPTLVRSILRRLSALTRVHCDREPAVDFASLVEEAKRVRTRHAPVPFIPARRRCGRSEETLIMGGFLGRIHLDGPLETVLPWLVLGQYVHVGKWTSFGMGRYRVTIGASGPRGDGPRRDETSPPEARPT